ncbi:uncharacterized protein Z520_04027 [Fonsecaea multimorphosa CBS 102226]|uniref:Uncharacterized protein n=1 Tax=Fonsecaea multimorphosa CBS 102226 TaxID=1442371 RepID=A0A0D2ITQ2_9EURO|nr:uncharacterized protein Z520_04027 [Fonsecaea multimorphosa CBS 102226]KIY00342.1 hypothetical protein Z520_04027 [Fonsecaea multimorphosa CBS 102226]OAL27174.1 hypothetical protein AYO22_03805 [Fonsecaea multimorphosa]
MASAVTIDTTPPQPHTLSEDSSMPFLGSPHQISPRESPYFARSSTPLQEPDAENNSSSPPLPYTFTPQHVKSLPRAWERRPATPFLARNDAQKIWKRVPLGVVGTNIGENWRKEARRLNTRPVKRLRIAHIGGEEEKENVAYVGSRWDEDEMTTPSPKRKAVECGGIADREEELQDQNIPDEADDRIEDDEDCGNSEPGTASPILGSHDGADSWIEDEGVGIETGPSTVLDSVSASFEAVDLPQLPSPIIEPVDVSSSSSPPPAAIQFMSNTPMKALDEDATSFGDREQDSQSSPVTASSGRNAEESGSSPPEDDDTAYLHDFLSRARARKAAKERGVEENTVQPNETAETENSSVEESQSCHIEDVTDPSIPTTGSEEKPTNLPAAQDPEVSVSPRRSSRLITRLPRLQKPVTSLPSNISLKRLSGTEFIAANHEAQSVAAATRTNTNKNKNGAVPAKVRLIQLHAELKAWQFSEEDGGPQPNLETTSKKRNHKGKEVTWAEKLATFQDGQELKGSGDEAGDESNEDRKPDSSAEVEGESKEGAEKLRSLFRHQNRGVRKVRKLRKLNAGSVNGTPAPKKTTSIPLPVGPNSSLSAKMDGLATPAENGLEGDKDMIHTRTRTRTRTRVSNAA